jgi:hypothetical protein
LGKKGGARGEPLSRLVSCIVVVGRKRERKERPVESRVVKSLSGGAERKRGGRRHWEPLGGRGSQAERKRGEQRR